MKPSIDKLLFAAAAGFQDAEERRVFLDHTCGNDPVLRSRVESLLEVSGAADCFFEFQPEVPADGDGDAGDAGLGVHIGRYRLIERIGEGGFGVVYLAEQRDPVRRKVALKIIRLGLDSPEAVLRFEAERQALASMNHPNIARVLDAGTASGGRPFFVMELVAGDRLTDYCDSRELDIPKRLGLFLDICRAIQHAHQKGVVHRDIKPSNILVETHESVPVPKVIDFGMAVAGGVNSGDPAAGEGKILGTPAYASPEQVSGGEAVDTRSDIYSLGILLGELLVGPPRHVPADLMGRPLAEIRAVLRSARPDPPSVALRSLESGPRAEVLRRRGVTEKRLTIWCENDLDWIVGRAVASDPKDRYETVNGLAMDIMRWLRDEPVQAHPPGRGYRFRKLVRRNRMVFGAGTLAALGLIGGMTIATHLFIRERAARAQQETLRERAETARAAEEELRRKSELLARVTQAAVRLNYNDLRQADELLAAIPIGDTPATVEAVNTYRRVAEWHLLEGRHEEAGMRFRAMVTALAEVDDTDSDAVSRHLLPAATAVCLSGGAANYDGFRAMALDRFSGTTHPVVAEQVLKACLLLPADEAVLERLAPLAGLVGAALADAGSPTSKDPDLAAWSCFALALMNYRAGDDASAAEWALRSLSRAGVNPSRSVSAKIVLGLVERRAGREASASAYLDSAEEEAGDRLRSFRGMGHTTEGFWFDWINIRLWLREAGRPTDQP